MVKPQDIDTTTVTPEQIGACHKVFEGSTPVYMVESETDNLTEYKVRWTREKAFSCTCPSGQRAFSNTKDGFCKHVRWSVAAAREEKQAVAELHAAIAAQAVKPVEIVTTVDAVTLARVQVASEAPVKGSKAKANSPKAFSILR